MSLLGTKENPHPWKYKIRGYIRKEDEFYLNSKGVLSIADKNGNLKPLPEFIKNDTPKKMGKTNNIIKYSDIVKIFDDCESELLWNEDDYKKNYKNRSTIIDYKCSMCNEEKKDSLSTIMRRKKSPITDNNVFCLSCHKKEVVLAGRATYESICDELKDTEYVLLWDEKIFNKRYKSARTKMKFKSKKCGHEFNATMIMMKSLYKYKKLSCCPDCNFKNTHNTTYINNNYNSLTNELRCKCCKKWKNKTDNFKMKSDGRFCLSCNDCEKAKRQLKYDSYTEEDYINSIVKQAKKRHNRRIKNGRIFKSDFNITTKDIYDLLKKQKNKCVYTGVNMIWKTNSGPLKGSLDRIDSDDTYCKNNIQLVCFWANQAKNNSTHEDFIKFCKLVAEHNK